MKYAIGTTLIVQEFNGKSYCPICQIKKIVDDRLVGQFLDEAVMEDHVRGTVNKLGFCEKHFDKLYLGDSKLGLALQCHTRLEAMLEKIGTIKSAKQAKKQAEIIMGLSKTCVICDLVEDHMSRYVDTIAKMYGLEDDFRQVFDNEKSFCFNHFADLLCSCTKAGKYADALVVSLNKKNESDGILLSEEIRAFCDRFDYRKSQKPMGEEKNALPKTRIKMYGKKL